jgi:hypothetical protein
LEERRGEIQGWELMEGKTMWPERMGEYEKDGNYRRENHGRKESGRINVKGRELQEGKLYGRKEWEGI